MTAKSSTSRPDGRGKIAVLALLAIGTLAFSLFLSEPGHIIGDESVYHLMTRSFAESGSLALLNGYEEFPSRELVFPVARPHDGLLFPQYPYLYPVLAAPFYLALGYQGLFLLNAIAFLGVVWLCYGICQLLFKDRDLSLNACLVLVLATYAWEYSQAAWPHAVSMLCIASAFYLTVSALQAAAVARALALAFAAGLVVGFGTGVRMEVIFTAPVLVLPFLFASPMRLWPSVAAGLGTLPGLAVLGATNSVKFGTFSPFSYGSKPAGSAADAAAYLPVVVLGGLVLLALWLLTRPRIRSLVNAHPWRFVAGLVVVAAAALLLPDVWAVLSRLAHGVYQLVVDLRIRDLAILEGALSRGPGGGMIYMGALKKSLLQSCPYLVVLLVVLLQLLRSGKDAAALSSPCSLSSAVNSCSWRTVSIIERSAALIGVDEASAIPKSIGSRSPILNSVARILPPVLAGSIANTSSRLDHSSKGSVSGGSSCRSSLIRVAAPRISLRFSFANTPSIIRKYFSATIRSRPVDRPRTISKISSANSNLRN